jgi:hypothetical protein
MTLNARTHTKHIERTEDTLNAQEPHQEGMTTAETDASHSLSYHTVPHAVTFLASDREMGLNAVAA